MNIDFHYGVVYVLCCLAGMPVADARTVARACEYIDDATTGGLLFFEKGETFERFASANEMVDYQNADKDENRAVWAPFHFLPGGEGDTIEQKTICRPNSAVAQAMIQYAIAARAQDNALHRLGVSLHVYVDTFSHQGFSGITSPGNQVRELTAQPGLTPGQREALSLLLSTICDANPDNRLKAWSVQLNQGVIPGLHEPLPDDIPKDAGSWKYIVTGIATPGDDSKERPVWTSAFEDSDYRKFHDAAKEHRYTVTQQILPDHDVRLA